MCFTQAVKWWHVRRLEGCPRACVSVKVRKCRSRDRGLCVKTGFDRGVQTDFFVTYARACLDKLP